MDYNAITGLGTFLLAIAAILTIMFDQAKRLRNADNLRSQIMLYVHQLVQVVENEILSLEKLRPPKPSSANILTKITRNFPSFEKYLLAITPLFTQSHMLRPIENNKLLSILLIIQDLEAHGQAIHPYYQLYKLKELHILLVNYINIFKITDIPPALSGFFKKLILKAYKK